MTLPRLHMVLDEDISSDDIDDAEEECDPAIDAFAYLFSGIRYLCARDIGLLAPMIVDGVGVGRIQMFLDTLADQMPDYAEAQADYDTLVSAIEIELATRNRVFAVIFEEPATAA